MPHVKQGFHQSPQNHFLSKQCLWFRQEMGLGQEGARWKFCLIWDIWLLMNHLKKSFPFGRWSQNHERGSSGASWVGHTELGLTCALFFTSLKLQRAYDFSFSLDQLGNKWKLSNFTFLLIWRQQLSLLEWNSGWSYNFSPSFPGLTSWLHRRVAEALKTAMV